MTNPETVVIAGAVAEASQALIPTIEKQLPLYIPVPPRVFASAPGSEIVSIGAIRTALDAKEQNALECKLGALPSRVQTAQGSDLTFASVQDNYLFTK